MKRQNALLEELLVQERKEREETLKERTDEAQHVENLLREATDENRDLKVFCLFFL